MFPEVHRDGKKDGLRYRDPQRLATRANFRNLAPPFWTIPVSMLNKYNENIGLIDFLSNVHNNWPTC